MPTPPNIFFFSRRWVGFPVGFPLLEQAVYSSSGDEGMLKEWDATALALKRELDLGGKSNGARIQYHKGVPSIFSEGRSPLRASILATQP